MFKEITTYGHIISVVQWLAQLPHSKKKKKVFYADFVNSTLA